jgi:hypothetical protein
MNVTAQFAAPKVTMKVGDPVHDEHGNVVGELVDWKQNGDRIEAVYSVTDEMAEKIRGKTGTVSMGTKLNG